MNKLSPGARKFLKAFIHLYLLLAPVAYAVGLPVFQTTASLKPFLFLFYLFLTPSLIGLVGKLLYDNYESIYFFVTRTFMQIINFNVQWSMRITYDGKFGKDTAQKIATKIVEEYPSSNLWHSEETKTIVSLSLGTNLMTQIQDSGETLFVQLSEVNVPFRKSEKILEEILSVISNQIIPIAKPDHEKYSLFVGFGEINPYFGLFVRRLRMQRDQSLIQFRVEYEEKVGTHNERIDVTQDRVALTTDNLSNLHTLSKRYITLASLDMTATSS